MNWAGLALFLRIHIPSPQPAKVTHRVSERPAAVMASEMRLRSGCQWACRGAWSVLGGVRRFSVE